MLSATSFFRLSLLGLLFTGMRTKVLLPTLSLIGLSLIWLLFTGMWTKPVRMLPGHLTWKRFM